MDKNKPNIEWIGEILAQNECHLDVLYKNNCAELTNEAMDEAVILFAEGTSGFEKIAQQRSFMQWLHEKANLSRHGAEAFSANYQEQMRLLRDVDDSIRRMAGNIKSSLALAQKSLKQRRYLDVAHFIGNINDDLRSIVNERHLIKGALNHHLEDFYGQHEHADLGREYFKKNAGIMDFFADSSRRKAGKLFEKMYENVLKERKRALNQLTDEVTVLVEYTFEVLKDLGTYRARGDIGAYLGELDKLAKKRDVFEVKFKQTYEAYIKPMIDKIKAEQKEKEEMFAGPTAAEPVEEANPIDLVNKKPSREIPDLQGPAPRASVSPPEPVLTPDAPSAQPVAETAPEAAVEAPQAIELVTQPEPESFIMPDEFKSPQNIEIETGAKLIPGAVPRAKPMTMKQRLRGRADEVVMSILKSGNSVSAMKEALLVYSEEYDEAGDEAGSLKCLAAAEGMDDEENLISPHPVNNDRFTHIEFQNPASEQLFKSKAIDHPDLLGREVSGGWEKPENHDQFYTALQHHNGWTVQPELMQMRNKFENEEKNTAEKLKEYIQRGELKRQVKARIADQFDPIASGKGFKDSDFDPETGLSTKTLQSTWGHGHLELIKIVPPSSDKTPQEFNPNKVQDYRHPELYQVVLANRTFGVGKTELSALYDALRYFWPELYDKMTK